LIFEEYELRSLLNRILIVPESSMFSVLYY